MICKYCNFSCRKKQLTIDELTEKNEGQIKKKIARLFLLPNQKKVSKVRAEN